MSRPAPAGLGVADRPDHGLDGLLEAVPVGRDDPGVGRDTQRRHRARRVEPIAAPQRLEDGDRLGPVGIEAALLGAPAGALLD